MKISILDTQEKILTKVLMLKGEKGDKGDAGELTNLDTALSTTSTNAVQNKVITNALNTLTENSATNSFTDGIDSLFKDVTANIQPVQAGSGTPSPTNVRTISGFTECTVTDTNGTDTNTATISFGSAGTVYGGTVDLTSGTLIVDRGYLQPTSAEQVATSGSKVYWVIANNLTSINGVNGLMSSHFEPASGVAEGHCYITGNGVILVAVPTDQTLNTTSLANEWLATNQPQFVYPLATPQTYQLTPTQLRSLVGTNNLTSNTGDTVEVEYITNETIAWLIDLINA